MLARYENCDMIGSSLGGIILMSQSARSRRRAEKALAEGRTPGKPGMKRKYTDEEFREVIRVRNAAYRAAHKEELREKAKLDYHARVAAPVEEPKKRGRPLKYKTPEEFKAANREKAYRWRQENREQYLAILRASGKKIKHARALAEGREPGLVGNPYRFKTEAEREAAVKARSDRYWAKRGHEARLEHWRRHQHLRRARVYGAEGTYTKADIERLYDLQKGNCVFCLGALGKEFDIDHYMPLVRGGRNDPSNLRLMHRKCNVRKSARDPVDHALKNGMLCW